MSWNFLEKNNKTELRHSFFDSVKMINSSHWDDVVGGENVYLSRNYLQSLEDALSNSIDFRYIIFYCKNYNPVGVAAVQILDFVDKNEKYNDALCVVGKQVKHKLLKHLDIKVMVCGNAFATGENGFMFNSDIDPSEAYLNLSNALYRLRRSEALNGRVSIILLKEFWPASFEKAEVLKKHDFREFKIDVNMVLKIHESWQSMDDYLGSMVSKFRTKAKSVFKKSEDLEVVNMDALQIENNKVRLQELYTTVVRKADFKFGELNGDAFVNFKKNLGDSFVLRGYYLNNSLIGFSTAFVAKKVVDANYVGLDYAVNQDVALYQRMLYDFVDLAIENRVEELHLGRTAEEIKSCLGAEPMDMKLYVKHRNSVSNKLIKPIVESIHPSEFELRHPFKASFV